ncbi:MAG: DUF4251 domain-containing protein [Cyclobacteriaceae bacterium]
MNLLSIRLVVIALNLICITQLVAQDKSKNGELSKKEQQELAFNSDREVLMQMANDRDIIVEANAVYMMRWFNTSEIGPNNFISIDGDNFMLQTSTTVGPGQNGLGGYTLRGTVTSYEVKPGKGKRPITITAQVSTLGFGFATVIVRLFDEANSQVTYSNSSTTITLSGPVKTKANSQIYKGIPIY